MLEILTFRAVSLRLYVFSTFLVESTSVCATCVIHIKGKNGNNTTDSWVELTQQYEDPECLSATAQSQASGAAEEDAASVLLHS